MSFTTTINGIKLEIPSALVKKYNTAVPRYTSYPTAPVWTDKFGPKDYIKALSKTPPSPPLKKGGNLSLYFHIPFCESRCLFCGCSTIATPHHEVADRYIEALGKEIALVAKIIGKKNNVVQLHFGGGSPTYLSPSQLERLWQKISGHFAFDSKPEIGIEADPRVTTTEHLKTLRSLGFNRLSLGVQDFSEAVMNAIGRTASFEEIRQLIETSRDLEYESVNLDLIYGLPHQTATSFKGTIEKIISLSPDRIACFNFAYLPKMLPHQRRLPADKLPSPDEKFAIFCMAIAMLGAAGYDLVGMDHFAKKGDELSVAASSGTLWRNFQGYGVNRGQTPSKLTALQNVFSQPVVSAGSDPADPELIGFGLTSISDLCGCYAQNSKKLIDYYRRIESEELATVKGWRLSGDDLIRRKLIRELFCKGVSSLSPLGRGLGEGGGSLVEDGLIKLSNDNIQVTPLGRLFVRNIATVFDEYLQKTSASFSKAV